MGDDESVTEHLDVLIVGAGLAGIGTACHLERDLPGLSYAVLESRPVSGGTWDLFRYPGIRSDSDMFTLGYSFRPWPTPEAIANGESILRYLRETAEEYGVTPKIRYGSRVVSASWSSSQARWLVSFEDAGGEQAVSCSFLHLSTGYYDYADPYLPSFPGVEHFTGELVHPQLWSPETAWAGKDVVVIGSGATAVSILPAIAAASRSAVMLQRSPSYVISLPSANSSASRRWPAIAQACVSGRADSLGDGDERLLAPLPPRPRSERELADRSAAGSAATGLPHGELHAPLSALGSAALRGAGR